VAQVENLSMRIPPAAQVRIRKTQWVSAISLALPILLLVPSVRQRPTIGHNWRFEDITLLQFDDRGGSAFIPGATGFHMDDLPSGKALRLLHEKIGHKHRFTSVGKYHAILSAQLVLKRLSLEILAKDNCAGLEILRRARLGLPRGG
jgi:hypothetical protein